MMGKYSNWVGLSSRPVMINLSKKMEVFFTRIVTKEALKLLGLQVSSADHQNRLMLPSCGQKHEPHRRNCSPIDKHSSIIHPNVLNQHAIIFFYAIQNIHAALFHSNRHGDCVCPPQKRHHISFESNRTDDGKIVRKLQKMWHIEQKINGTLSWYFLELDRHGPK